MSPHTPTAPKPPHAYPERLPLATAISVYLLHSPLAALPLGLFFWLVSFRVSRVCPLFSAPCVDLSDFIRFVFVTFTRPTSLLPRVLPPSLPSSLSPFLPLSRAPSSPHSLPCAQLLPQAYLRFALFFRTHVCSHALISVATVHIYAGLLSLFHSLALLLSFSPHVPLCLPL